MWNAEALDNCFAATYSAIADPPSSNNFINWSHFNAVLSSFADFCKILLTVSYFIFQVVGIIHVFDHVSKRNVAVESSSLHVQSIYRS